jgi:hypothetical protein
MAYTLGQAAKATGKTKTTIAKSIENGRISAQKNEFGQYQIEPAELHRVYPPRPVEKTPQVDDTRPHKDPEILHENERLRAAVEVLKKERDRLEADLTDARHERDEWREEAKAVKLLVDQRPRDDLYAVLLKRLDALEPAEPASAPEPVHLTFWERFSWRRKVP